MTSPPRLRLDELVVPFGDAVGLHPLSLQVEAGERLVIVGSSGAGKSSLLRAIAGLRPARAGTLSIDGVDRTRVPAEARGAVYLHQTPLLFPHLSVFENVAFPLRIRGRPAGEVRNRVETVLQALGIDDLRERRPAALSGGQAHRAALARAIVARPPVLLLDEPLSSLDPPLREEARRTILAALAEYDPATIIVTHDLAEAGAMGHRLGVLLDRGIAQLDSPEAVFNAPVSEAVAGFVGFDNRIVGSLDQAGTFTSVAGTFSLTGMRADLRPGPAVLRTRAEAIRFDPEGTLAGKIIELQHRPGAIHLRIRTSGGDIAGVLPSGELVPDAGREARFRILPAHAALFPLD